MQSSAAIVVLALATCGLAQKFKSDDGSITMMVEDGKSIKMQIGQMSIDPSTIPGDIEKVKQDSMMYTSQVNMSLHTALHEWAGDIEDDVENITEELGKGIEQVRSDLMDYADVDKEKVRTGDAISTAVDALGIDDLKSTVKDATDNITKTQAWQEAHKKCLAQKKDMKEDGTCVDKNFLIPSRHWNDVRKNGCWETVRTWEAQKLNPSSWFQLMYTDTLGFYSQSNQHTTACRWRIMIDGKTFREHYTHSQNRMGGWHIFPTTLTNYYSPADFKHQWYQTHLQNHKFEIQSCRNGGSGQCLQGWPTNANGASVITREVDPSLLSVARYMDDKRMKGTGWATIPGRVVAHTVAEDKSVLIVTYSDTMGRYEYGRDNQDTCGVKLIMAGNGATKSYVEHRTASGSRSTWFLMPGTIRWVIPAKDIGKGKKLTFSVQARRFGAASECAYGWSNRNVHNTLAVEEITETRQKTLAIKATGMKPFTSTSTGWADIPARTLTFNKQSADSVLVVSYSDIFGYQQRAQTTACRFRVLFSNNRRDTQEKYSHSGGGYGYRYYNFQTQWTCTTCPKGSLAIKIQVVRSSGGANRCVLGKSINDQGVLTVEEVSAP